MAALAVMVGGCLPALPRVESRPTPTFDPIAFFEGPTEGLGTLSVRARSPVLVRVESVGTRRPDGGLSLRQTIRRGGGPTTERTWELAPDGPGRYAGTLTDADGPVEAWADGDRLSIRYGMGGGLSMRQELTLQPGGDLALNLATVRWLGVPVARLSEQIRRVGR
ncbi:DUF3833 family protein [Rubrivirga sp.]|uniref:DUF3833 family protein n=1 Tax=Rubrivirga sp. TaxID=1885344 RepID=UPI003B5223BE